MSILLGYGMRNQIRLNDTPPRYAYPMSVWLGPQHSWSGLSGYHAHYSVAFIYTFIANTFFLLRSLRSVVSPDAGATPGAVGTVSRAQRSRRITFLFLVAVVQILFMGVLVRV
ncbi:hypothetical protein EDB85DRAFT_2024659 [Lactarius pseudohatsudake]|nr:hypothetical protein EDB85DRAFT_2024659 [Lactarius pseudohatsudake]